MKKTIHYFTCFLSLFSFVGCQQKNAYEIKEGKVYHTWINGGNYKKMYRLLDGADATTFKTIKQRLKIDLGKDKNHVYVNAQLIKGANPSSFRQIKGYYWCDNIHVYLLNTGDTKYDVLTGADPTSFTVLKKNSWAKDAKNVFYRQNQLPKVDTKKFVVIDTHWAKDGTYFYYQKARLDSLDYATAEILNEYYIKDKHKVFYMNKPLDNADPETFEVNKKIEYYGHDKTNMFQWEKNKGPITKAYREQYINN